MSDQARDEAIETALDMMAREGGDCELAACIGPPRCTEHKPTCRWCEVFYVDADGRATVVQRVSTQH
jgi:hypothetical protein